MADLRKEQRSGELESRDGENGKGGRDWRRSGGAERWPKWKGRSGLAPERRVGQ